MAKGKAKAKRREAEPDATGGETPAEADGESEASADDGAEEATGGAGETGEKGGEEWESERRILSEQGETHAQKLAELEERVEALERMAEWTRELYRRVGTILPRKVPAPPES